MPTFTINNQRIDYIKNKNVNLINNIIFTNTVSKFGTVLESIKSIDLCCINIEIMNFIPAKNYHAIMREIYILYIFAKIFNKITIGGNLCITFSIFDLYYSSKIMSEK